MRYATAALIAFALTCVPAGCRPPADGEASYDDVVADVACGQCQFGLAGSGCDLAVRLDGTAYYVDGSSIDDHGDAHADDGLCNAVRPARVSGRIEDGRFVATSVELMQAVDAAAGAAP